MSTDFSSIRKTPSSSSTLSAGSVGYINRRKQHNDSIFKQYTSGIGGLIIYGAILIGVVIFIVILVYNKYFKNKDIEDDE